MLDGWISTPERGPPWTLPRTLAPRKAAWRQALCTVLRPLLTKYPFDRNATAEASVAELDAAFRRPDGAFWAFYDAHLQKLVVRHGSRFVLNRSASVRLTPEFLAFLNQVSTLTDDVYSRGAQDPHFAYTRWFLPASWGSWR
jgi:type VI secretion system protein ImpL